MDSILRRRTVLTPLNREATDSSRLTGPPRLHPRDTELLRALLRRPNTARPSRRDMRRSMAAAPRSTDRLEEGRRRRLV